LRIQQGLATAVPASDPLPLFKRVRAEWVRQLRHGWDAVGNRWNQWVLGYTPERQTRFLASIGLPDVTWQQMVMALTLATGTLLLMFALMMLWRLRAHRVEEVQKLWLRFCRAMAARGLPRKPSEGPRDYAARISRTWPHLAQRVEPLSTLYIRMRYGEQRTALHLAQLRNLIRGLDRHATRSSIRA
jgi:hypothetical protein